VSAEPDPDVVARHRRLRETLMREVFQAERSAESHCTQEAGRLGGSTPASALRAVALHANRINHELPAVARAHKLPASGGGRLLGRALSLLRTAVIDRTVEEERSYRATLAGLRHGIDVVRMLQHVADASGEVTLGGFCAAWLAEREPLVADVAKAMRWFAHHPAAAEERPGWSGTVDHIEDPGV